MECGKIQEVLGFYAEGALAEREMRAVSDHLAECAECRRELAAMTALVGAARMVDDLQPPSSLRASIAAATTQRRAVEEPVRVGFVDWLRGALQPSRMGWTAGAGVVAVALIVGGPNHAPTPQISSAKAPGPAATAAKAAPASTSTPPVVTTQPSLTDSASAARVTESKRGNLRAAAKRVAKRHHPKTKAVHMAKLPAKPRAKTKPVTEHKLPVVVEPPLAVEAEVAVDVRDRETEEVALAPKVEPVSDPQPLREVREKLATAAAAPVLKREDMQAMLEQAKTMSAAMRQARKPAGVSFVTTKF